MDIPYIISIQVGLPGSFKLEDTQNRPNSQWTTGFFKKPIEGLIWLGKYNLSGDGQADLKYHGGLEKAVLAYSADHYPSWSIELGNLELPYGAFGENFTVSGLTEETVCIGDTYAVGEAHLQISQPRQPCWKISRRWGIDDLEARVKITGRTGWYFRVLKEGYIEPGLPLILLDRPFPHWNIAYTYRTMLRRDEDPHAAIQLASCPLLSANWRSMLSQKAPEYKNIK